jgi:hypothetical protein
MVMVGMIMYKVTGNITFFELAKSNGRIFCEEGSNGPRRAILPVGKTLTYMCFWLRHANGQSSEGGYSFVP